MRLLEINLGRPLVRGGLTLFPIWNGAATAARDYGIGGEHVRVDERAGAAVVGELVATNTGPRPELVLAGELLEGGQQHRVAARSVIIDAGAAVVLDVRCVEEGRWSGTRSHSRSGRRAPVSVRAADGQSAVWERIRRYEQLHGATETHSVLEATRSTASAAAALVRGVRPLPFQTGLLVGIAGQPLIAEVFDSPMTLRHVWRSLLRSAAMDAVHAPAIPTPGRRARRFVERLDAVPVQQREAGNGTAIEGRSEYVRLDALVWQGRAVHSVASSVRHELVSA